MSTVTHMAGLRFVHPTGVPQCDTALLKAVVTAAPFAPLPNGAPDFITIQYTFKYNVFKQLASNGAGAGAQGIH